MTITAVAFTNPLLLDDDTPQHQIALGKRPGLLLGDVGSVSSFEWFFRGRTGARRTLTNDLLWGFWLISSSRTAGFRMLLKQLHGALNTMDTA